MLCSNFVCAFSRSERGKILCDYDGLSDCDINCQMSCKRFHYLSCKWCGFEYACFHQGKKNVSYSSDIGYFVPTVSVPFIEKAKQNDFANAKRDIFATSCCNYAKGYKIETTVNYFYKKYNKQFPQFTKEFIREAVYKSILYYLKNQ